MWRRDVDGLALTFHLAGINNQNFLMRDEQTGTYWQQISGVAISGPLAGKRLTRVYSDELTAGVWKNEEPHGMVLQDVAAYRSEYASKNWDRKMKRVPTVIGNAQPGLAPRDLMLGVQAFGVSRAFPFETVLKQKLINDHVGAEPLLLVVGPDNTSIRVFRSRFAGAVQTPEFYRIANGDALMMDEATGSHWNFRGCAIAGKAAGTCLERVEAIKDYWFDWRQYNPATTVYRQPNSAAKAE